MARTKYHHLYKRCDTWYFRKGKTRLSLETTTATEALRLRDRMLENFRMTGEFIVPAEDDSPTFGQVAKEWAEIHTGKVKYSTWRDYRSAMNGNILPAFKDCPINVIGYLDVEKFISRLNCGPKRINNILVPMRSVFKMAHKHGYVQDNVMLKVENRPLEQPDIYPFAYEDVLRFLDAVDPYYRPYSSIRFFTGMRSGEIDALLWSDYKTNMTPRPKLHINKAFVYGQDGKTKTKKSKRYVDCIELVVEALKEQRQISKKGPHIFLTKGESRMNPDHFRNVVWNKALEKAGLEYRPPIQTRHTFATMMISAGEDIGWVQSMLGHSSLQMIFTRYFAWIPRRTRNDGAAFIASTCGVAGAEVEKLDNSRSSKVISLFRKNDTKTTHPDKKGATDLPVTP